MRAIRTLGVSLALLLLPLLAACSDGPQPRGAGDAPPPAVQVDPLPEPPPLAPREVARELPPRVERTDDRLQTSVVVAITVTHEPALSLARARIGPDGKVFVPFLGRMEAAGATPLELADRIARAYADRGYLRYPQVDVEVLEQSGRRAYVLGRVSRPGDYDLPFDRELTLTQLIAKAGGLATSKADLAADPSAIRLIRQGKDGERHTYRLSFLEIVDEGNLGADVVIHDGDVVYVPPKQELVVFGAVNKPGSFPLADGSRLGVDEVLALAGGFTPLADVEGVLLIRRSPAGAQTYLVPSAPVKRAAVEVTASDTIIVPTRNLSRVYLLGAVDRQGGIPLDEPDLTVTKVLALAGGLSRIAAANSVQLIRSAGGKKTVYSVPVADIIESGDLSRDPVLEPGDIIWVPEGIF